MVLSPLGSRLTAMACIRSPAAELTVRIISSLEGGVVMLPVWRMTSSRGVGFVARAGLPLLWVLFVYCYRGVICKARRAAYVSGGPVAVVGGT